MNKEENVTWKNGILISEGLFLRNKNETGVVICHPHPQMGGDMYNNVTAVLQDVFAGNGFSTLRFNFRGVGASTGQYDEGEGEKQDVLSACDFLKQQGIKDIIFAGYSFGSWVGSNVIRDNPYLFKKTFMVSPPDKFIKFNWNGLEDKIDLIVCGKLDPFCDINDLKKYSKIINADFMVMESADHFYSGQELQLAEYLNKYVKRKIK